EDEVLDRAVRRIEEVFGVAVAGAVEVDRRLRLSPDVDLAQDGAVYIGGVIHTPGGGPQKIHKGAKFLKRGENVYSGKSWVLIGKAGGGNSHLAKQIKPLEFFLPFILKISLIKTATSSVNYSRNPQAI